MSKRFLTVIFVIIFIATLIWFYADPISQQAQSIFDFDDQTRTKANEWIGITGGVLAIFGAVIAVVKTIWKFIVGNKETTNPTHVTTFEDKVTIKGDFVQGSKSNIEKGEKDA